MSYLCKICAESDILCSACSDKLKSGELTEYDIKLARFLHSLRKDVKILKTINGKSVIIVVEKGDAPKLIGKAGSTAKAISKHCKKPVKIIEFSEINEFLDSLLGDSFISLTEVYKREGEAYKLRIRKKRIREKDIKSLIKSLYGKEVEIVYE